MFALAVASHAAQFDYGPQPYGPLQTEERWGTYQSDAAEGDVRYFLVKPKGEKLYPGIYYIYGRPGFDHRLMPELHRLASFGFTVFVAHFQEALLIPVLIPVSDPPEVVPVQIDGFQAFMKLKERSPGPVCIVSTVRGGQYALRLASQPEVACYVGYHPVFTDHSLPEQHQDVMLMPEVRNLKVPTLLMVGDWDFEVRVNQSKRIEQYLKMHGIPVELVIYPEAQRGFDFRVNGRSLADDLAKIDSMNRTVAFVSKYLGGDSNLDMDSNAMAPLPSSITLVPQPKVVKRPRATSKASAISTEDGQ